MGFNRIIKGYLVIIIIPISTVILFYAFLYSGLFLIFDRLSFFFSDFINKKKDIPFTVFDSIIASYCTTSIIFVLILSFCIFKYRNKKKLFIGLILSDFIMTIILVKYLLLII
jgi:hypothetical protein